MTPGARVAAAIEVLDLILGGSTPEQAISGWGRSHRFAGSKDRAAIRDHVFQALRCRASYGWIGGSETGRGLMLGATAEAGTQEALFSGDGHAPPVPTLDEVTRDLSDAPRHIRLDMPEWLLPHFDGALGENADEAMGVLRTRAGVFLRVNAQRSDAEDAAEILLLDGIKTMPVSGVSFALQVIENERRVAQSQAYSDGLVELQDPSSQAAILALRITDGLRVLDLCAGGGGKALAMAALGAHVTAHDIDPRRMVDLAPRAERAGVTIQTVATADLAGLPPFDLVLVDAPCSGSGTWRRTPAAKWSLTAERLQELTGLQDSVLTTAGPLVAKGGRLAYATCSVFEIENNARIEGFIDDTSMFEKQFDDLIEPHRVGDGFYLSVMKRSN